MKIMKTTMIIMPKMIGKWMNKNPFVLYALMILAVSFSCTHKEAPTDSTKQDEVKQVEEIQSVDFFGIPLHGKDVACVLKMMEEKVDVLALNGELNDEQDYCRVLFCGVPCGMNMKWDRGNDEVYITSLNFFTSQTSDEAIEALVKGVSSYYGECRQSEQDEMDDYFRWDGVLMRPVHSEEGGMTVIF